MKLLKSLHPILSLVCLLILTSCNQQGKSPNILFILADDVGREVLGCYGGTSYETSNIDGLASKGMRLNHVYSSPVGHPGRISLMTGRYPFRFGDLKSGTFPKSAEGQTFANELKKAGYATAVAGKWQLTTLGDDPDHPHRLGFDEYCLFGWHEGPRYHQPMIWQNGKIREGVKESYGPDIYSDFLIDFMASNVDRPFLAYYPMALIHDVSDDLSQPPPFGPKGRYENVEEMVSEMNRIVGKMVQALTNLGIEDNTVIIFSSDNGTSHSSIISHENGEFVKEKVFSRIGGMRIAGGKTKFTDWGTRVPTLVVWPKQIKPGIVSDAMIDFSDFLPTILDLAKQKEQTYRIDGNSFARVLTGKDRESRDWVFCQNDAGQYMIRSRDWKLLWDGKLFDMKNDPLEALPMSKDIFLHGSDEAKFELDSILNVLSKGL